MRRLGNLTIGAGAFVSRDNVIRVSAAETATADGGDGVLAQVDFDIAEVRYHLGAGVGGEFLGGKLRLGASAFVVYDSTNDSLALAASRGAGGDPTAIDFHVTARTSRAACSMTPLAGE